MMNQNGKNMFGYKPKIKSNNKEPKQNDRYSKTNKNFFENQKINIKEEKPKINNINVFQSTTQSANLNNNFTRRFSQNITKKEINNEINKNLTIKEDKKRRNIKRSSSYKKNLYDNNFFTQKKEPIQIEIRI